MTEFRALRGHQIARAAALLSFQFALSRLLKMAKFRHREEGVARRGDPDSR
jgi:hypothetical protein